MGAVFKAGGTSKLNFLFFSDSDAFFKTFEKELSSMGVGLNTVPE